MTIESFKHKELENLATGKIAKINSEHVEKLEKIFSVLNNLRKVSDLSRSSSFQTHPLDGKLKGYLSIKVNGNWRVTFKFKNGNVYDLDYVDYH